jgi:hypothetical protein
MQSALSTDRSVNTLTRLARPVTGAPNDYDSLLGLIGDRRFVLIGEASHGTHEFFRERARITRRLIDELGFTVVAVEGDWPESPLSRRGRCAVPQCSGQQSSSTRFVARSLTDRTDRARGERLG